MEEGDHTQRTACSLDVGETPSELAGRVNRTPSHVTFSRECVHSYQCRT